MELPSISRPCTIDFNDFFHNHWLSIDELLNFLQLHSKQLVDLFESHGIEVYNLQRIWKDCWRTSRRWPTTFPRLYACWNPFCEYLSPGSVRFDWKRKKTFSFEVHDDVEEFFRLHLGQLPIGGNSKVHRSTANDYGKNHLQITIRFVLLRFILKNQT